jgi:hypothetical protein
VGVHPTVQAWQGIDGQQEAGRAHQQRERRRHPFQGIVEIDRQDQVGDRRLELLQASFEHADPLFQRQLLVAGVVRVVPPQPQTAHVVAPEDARLLDHRRHRVAEEPRHHAEHADGHRAVLRERGVAVAEGELDQPLAGTALLGLDPADREDRAAIVRHALDEGVG